MQELAICKHLSKVLWVEIMSYATYVINWVPLSLINMKFPYEMVWSGNQMSKQFKILAWFVVFIFWMFFKSSWRQKPKNNIYVGYDERKKVWKCMVLEIKKSLVSKDVFDKLTYYYKKDGDCTITNESFQFGLVDLTTPPISSTNPHVTNELVSSLE